MSVDTYITTDRAGPRVAGRIVHKVGQELELTAAEADYELREGTIVRKGGKPLDFGAPAGKKVEKARQETKAFRERLASEAPDGPEPAADPSQPA